MDWGYLFPEVLKEWGFTYITGRIRAEEKYLLNQEILHRLLEAATPESTWNLLTDSVFSSVKDRISGPKDMELAQNLLLADAFSLIKPLRSFSKWIELLTLRYDFFNIKVVIKTKYLGREEMPQLFWIGKIDPDRLVAAVYKEQYLVIPGVYAKAIEQVLQEYRKVEDPQCIDLILDKLMFSYLLAAVEDEPDFLKQFFQISADLFNLLAFLRIKAQDKGLSFLRQCLVGQRTTGEKFLFELYNLPFSSIKARLAEGNYSDIVLKGIQYYEETGSFGLLEKLADDFLLDFVKIGKIVSFGPEPIIGYMVAREQDVKNVNIIWQGKLFNFPKEKIGEVLRKTYV